MSDGWQIPVVSLVWEFIPAFPMRLAVFDIAFWVVMLLNMSLVFSWAADSRTVGDTKCPDYTRN